MAKTCRSEFVKSPVSSISISAFGSWTASRTMSRSSVLPSPPIEVLGPPQVSRELAKLANDGMAELVRKYPDRFPGFIASLPMNDPEGLLTEAKRAVNDLGAVGVQIFTNVLGRPLTRPETMPLFDLMTELDQPIWLHPARGAGCPRLQR